MRLKRCQCSHRVRMMPCLMRILPENRACCLCVSSTWELGVVSDALVLTYCVACVLGVKKTKLNSVAIGCSPHRSLQFKVDHLMG